MRTGISSILQHLFSRINNHLTLLFFQETFLAQIGFEPGTYELSGLHAPSVHALIRVMRIFNYRHSCWSKLGFPTGRDSTSFQDNGTEVSSLSRNKGTTGQAQNLAKGRDLPGQAKSRTGRGTKRDRAEKDVLKQENDILKQKMMFYT